MSKEFILFMLVFVIGPQVVVCLEKCEIFEDPAAFIAATIAEVATKAETRLAVKVAKIDAAINATPAPSAAAKACLESLKLEIMKIAKPSDAVQKIITNCIAPLAASHRKRGSSSCNHAHKLAKKCVISAIVAVQNEITAYNLPSKVEACMSKTDVTSNLCADEINPTNVITASLTKVSDGLKTDIGTANAKVTTALEDSSLTPEAVACLNALILTIVAIGVPSADVTTSHEACIQNGYAGLKIDIDTLCATGTAQDKITFNTQKVLPMIKACEDAAKTAANAELTTLDVDEQIGTCRLATGATSTLCNDAIDPTSVIAASLTKVSDGLKTDIGTANAKVTTALEDSSLTPEAVACLNALILTIVAIGVPSADVTTSHEACIQNGYAGLKIDIDTLCATGTAQDKITFNTQKVLPMIKACEDAAKTAANAELTTLDVDEQIGTCRLATGATSTLCNDAIDPTSVIAASLTKVSDGLKTDIGTANAKVTTALEDSSLTPEAVACLNALILTIVAIGVPSAAVNTSHEACIQNGYAGLKIDIDPLCATGTAQDKITFYTQKVLPMIKACEDAAIIAANAELTTLDVDGQINTCRLATSATSTLCNDAVDPTSVTTASLTKVSDGLKTDIGTTNAKVTTALEDSSLTPEAVACLNALILTIVVIGVPSADVTTSHETCIQNGYADLKIDIDPLCATGTAQDKITFYTQKVLPMIKACEDAAIIAANAELTTLDVDGQINTCRLATGATSTLCNDAVDPTSVITASLTKVSDGLKTDIGTANDKVTTALEDSSLPPEAVACLNALILTIVAIGVPSAAVTTSHEACIQNGYTGLKIDIDPLCATGTAQDKITFYTQIVLPMIKACEDAAITAANAELTTLDVEGEIGNCRLVTFTPSTLCADASDSTNSVAASFTRVVEGLKADVNAAKADVANAAAQSSLSNAAKNCLNSLSKVVQSLGTPSGIIEMENVQCVMKVYIDQKLDIDALCAVGTSATEQQMNHYNTQQVVPKITICENASIASAKTALTDLNVTHRITTCSNM